MRSYDPKYDREDLRLLKPEPWQLKLLKLNPSYVFWGPHEDYMCKRDGGWESPLEYDSWAEHNVKLDELNEVVNFYFSIERYSQVCACGDGYSPDAQIISEPFRFSHVPTEEERSVLVKENRPIHERPNGSIFLDCISIHVLVSHWCKKKNVPIKCPVCDGHAYIYETTPAYTRLTYWLIHPRKGASRGVLVKHIKKSDLPAVFRFLSEAAKRNAERFEKVVAL